MNEMKASVVNRNQLNIRSLLKVIAPGLEQKDRSFGKDSIAMGSKSLALC